MNKKFKRIVFVLAAIVILALILIKSIKFQSVEEYYLTHMEDISEDQERIFISIRCDTVRKEENWKNLDEQLKNSDYVPEDGVILDKSVYALREGDTAFDVLKRACQYNEIQFDYQGAEETIYKTAFVKGIHFLYDRSCGELSGWMYRVNGKFPGVGASNYKLKDQDYIEWVYTCDLGKDVGDHYEKKEK